MKILHVTPTYLPATRYGGPIYSVHGLCKGLVEHGHDVHVFTTNVDGENDSNVPIGRPVVVDGVQVWYFSCGFGRRLYRSSGLLSELKKQLSSFDIVHVHSVFLWPTWVAARLATKNNIPYVLSPRGMLVKELFRKKSFFLKSLWIRLIERKNIKEASLIHFTAKVEQQEFDRFDFSHQQACVVPNGVDVVIEPKGQLVSGDVQAVIKGSTYILYLGRLNWKKGLDRLIKALSTLSGVHLVIAGNDEENYTQMINQLIDKHGVKDRVSMIPRFVKGIDKQTLFKHARLFVLPSYSENFGNTVPEAMAAGCPVLVTTEVGAADIVMASQCGFVVEAKRLAEGIDSLLNHESFAGMGEKGKAWVENNLSWKIASKDMLALYRSVIQ